MKQRLLVCALVALSALGACGPKRAGGVAPDALIVFPPPPDTPRIQFLTRISTSRDVEKPSGGFMDFLLGSEEAQGGLRIVKPYGVAIHRGKIYVCDTMLPGIDVIDLDERSFDHWRPRSMGALKKPINCFVDRETAHLYVADTERGQVVRFDPDGRYAGALGGSGIKPSDVFVAGDSVWVSDLAARRVRVYDKSTGRELFAFPDPASPAADSLYQPTNLYVRDDRVYVTDFGDFNVKVYSRSGEFIRAVGSYGLEFGQFIRPKGIAVDRDHNLYVVDAGFENVQVFDRDGQLLMFFGGEYQGPGNMWLPAKVIVDYDNLSYFQQYVAPQFALKYLILVTNQYGPDKVSVYGFVEPKQDTLGTTN